MTKIIVYKNGVKKVYVTKIINGHLVKKLIKTEAA